MQRLYVFIVPLLPVPKTLVSPRTFLFIYIYTYIYTYPPSYLYTYYYFCNISVKELGHIGQYIYYIILLINIYINTYITTYYDINV